MYLPASVVDTCTTEHSDNVDPRDFLARNDVAPETACGAMDDCLLDTQALTRISHEILIGAREHDASQAAPLHPRDAFVHGQHRHVDAAAVAVRPRYSPPPKKSARSAQSTRAGHSHRDTSPDLSVAQHHPDNVAFKRPELPQKQTSDNGVNREHRGKDAQKEIKKALTNKNTSSHGSRKEMEPNDTQFLPSQVYVDYQNALKHNVDPLSQDHLSLSPPPAATNVTIDTGPMSYHTGDTGHIDLFTFEDIYDEHGSDEPEGDTNDRGEDELGEDMALQSGTITSPAHLSPTTPGLAGHKRDIRGNIISPADRTPAPDLSSFFASRTSRPVMGLSQVFHQTQAPTSPPSTGKTRSDPVFERPSPEFRPGHKSSPAPETSSPVLARKGVQRPVAGPSDNYVSMRDSQEKRRREAIQKDTGVFEDQDELSPNNEQRKAELRRRKAAVAEVTNRLFSRIGAPSEKSRDKTLETSEHNAKENMTPLSKIGAKGHAIIISDDTPRFQERGFLNFSDDDSETESRDEYDELSQTIVNIPRSSPDKAVHTSIQRIRGGSSPGRGRSEKDVQDNRLVQSFHAGSNSYPSNLENYTPSQIVQVVHSQSNATGNIDNQLLRPPRPVLASSIDSRTFVSQSQQDFSVSSSVLARFKDYQTNTSSSIQPAPDSPIDDDGGSEGDGLDPTVSPPSSPPIVHGHESSLVSNANEDQQSKTIRIIADKSIVDDSDELHGHVDITPKYADLARAVKPKGMRSIPETSPASTGNINVIGDPEAVSPAGGEDELQQSQAVQAVPSRASNSEGFDTAQTHLTGSIDKISPKAPKSTLVSPRRSQPKRMKDIPLDPTPPSPEDMHNSIDVLNEDDYDFAAILNRSPPDTSIERPLKRTRIQTRALQEVSVIQNKILPSQHTTPRKHPLRQEVFTIPETDEPTKTLSATSHADVLSTPTDQARSLNAINRSFRSEQESVSNGEQNTGRITANGPATKRKSLRKSQEGNEKSQDQDDVSPADEVHTVEDGDQLIVDTSIPTKRFPKRVLAHFRGKNIAFWPATCVEPATIDSSVIVRFDDGNQDELPCTSVFAFDLRPGDLVKLDQNENRSRVYTVCGMADPLPLASRSEWPETDVFGNKSVLLRPKQRGGKSSVLGSEDHPLKVPIAKVYVPSSLIRHYSDRVYQAGTLSTTRLETPTTFASAPTTPSSRTRKRVTSTAGQEAPSSSMLGSKNTSGLFQNMAFAVSFADNSDKEKIIELIREQGGRILPDGFVALFDLPESLTVPSDTPVESPPVSSHLTLTTEASDLGFVALITSHHNRREKYVQALALDLPCLSGRWIHDCVTKEKVLAWNGYLLPAGESQILRGAVRSRTLHQYTSFDANVTDLNTTISRRNQIIAGKSVILVVDKATLEERRRMYVFLTFALGATRVERVKDIATARILLSEPEAPWDWVSVEDENVEKAAADLAGTVTGKGSIRGRSGTAAKRRKRQSGGEASGVDGSLSGNLQGEKLSCMVSLSGTGHERVRVVCHEFLLQTLIFGDMIEN